jgi:hypothetical protein
MPGKTCCGHPTPGTLQHLRDRKHLFGFFPATFRQQSRLYKLLDISGIHGFFLVTLFRVGDHVGIIQDLEINGIIGSGVVMVRDDVTDLLN